MIRQERAENDLGVFAVLVVRKGTMSLFCCLIEHAFDVRGHLHKKLKNQKIGHATEPPQLPLQIRQAVVIENVPEPQARAQN